MKKTIENLVTKLGDDVNGRLTGGFINIKGGSGLLKKIITNGPPSCSNSGTCTSTNNISCENSGDCRSTTNGPIVCHNTGQCAF